MTANEKVNILMVDDQPAKLLSYEVILAELGENLLKATSGTEALEQLLPLVYAELHRLARSALRRDRIRVSIASHE